MAAVLDDSHLLPGTDPDPFRRGVAPAAGDAFFALYAALRRPLQRFFSSYRLNADDADDLTQEVFLRVMRPGCADGLRDPEAFVFTLARNLVRDRARRLHTRCAKLSVAIHEVDLASASPTPEEALELEDRLRSADRVLRSLKATTREAFILRRVHEEEYVDIASQMGVSVSMIEKHIMAATAALRNVDA